MDELLASDINQDGKRQAVTMCGVVSEDRFRDAQLTGGKNKPGIILPLHPCDNTSNDGSCNQSRALVFPTSHSVCESGGLQSPAFVVEQDSIDNLPGRIGNLRLVKGLHADDGSPVFDRCRNQIGKECAVKQPD